MKKLLLLTWLLVLLVGAPSWAQNAPIPNQTSIANQTASAPSASNLTRFNLDFPGGTPAQLVAAIDKASGHHLNAIIPTEYAATPLPPLNMTNVNVAELFDAMGQVIVQKSHGPYQLQYAAYFRTRDPAQKQTDDTIWTFFVSGNLPANLPVETRFYLLSPYLASGLTVDDITTAIQTAWRMAGSSDVPALSYHKETKLLIAVGDQSKVQVIDGVLHALDPLKDRAKQSGQKPEVKKD